MLCQNCGENEGDVRYTQIINGEKKEMILCTKCAKEIGIEDIDFNLPINFSSFLGDLLDDYNESFMPSFLKQKTLKCNKCGLTYEDFVEKGKFGCENCYEAFNDKINHLVKNLHGFSNHIGRSPKFIKENKKNNKLNKEENKNNTNSNEENEIERLNMMLKEAIKEERYEDAANIRDEIKKLNEK